MTDDIHKLLGGYATGTLTEEERQALFEAALHDQTIFEALAEEQPLKDLLEDSSAHADLLRATESAQFGVGTLLWEWFDRPKAKVLVGVGVLLLAAIAVRVTVERSPASSPAQTTAELRMPQARPSTGASEPQPLPASPPVLQSKPAAKRAAARPEKNQTPVAGALTMESQRAEVSPPAAPKEEPSPDTLTRVAEAGGVQLKYTVLRQNENGEYVAVSPDYVFEPNDRARIRVEANRPGMLSVKSPGSAQALTIRNVGAASPLVLPGDVTFEGSGPQVLQIAFVPQVAVRSMAFSATGDSVGSRSAGPQNKALDRREEAAAMISRTDASPAAVSVEIKLERKQP